MLLKAIIGSLLAAICAGNKPKVNPIVLEEPQAITIPKIETLGDKGDSY